ncbi:hypothetical protein IC229_05870 [Spirosoma sp. BT702]|uniref:Uncharacterized protein n=1 Tax=Spirosoma profusum TaxID=2771354 RepID=A0A927AQC9_9BACT|nr:hypothetical protein [Spirosoma profusum]MBD2700153.1 hypothetical protein [Spirosoma profusum]
MTAKNAIIEINVDGQVQGHLLKDLLKIALGVMSEQDIEEVLQLLLAKAPVSPKPVLDAPTKQPDKALEGPQPDPYADQNDFDFNAYLL